MARARRALVRLLEPPRLGDEEERRAIALANAVLWITLGGVVLYALGTIRMPVSLWARAPLLIAILVPVFGLRALRRGRLRATAFALVATFVVVPIWGALRSGGVHAPGIAMLSLAVVLAGHLLGARAALAAAAISVLAVVGMLLLARADLLPAALIRHDDVTFSLAFGILLAALGAVAAIAARALNDMVRDLRRERQALEDANAFVRETLDAIPDAIVTLDDSGIVLETNRAHERLVERSRHEIVGQHILAGVDMSPSEVRAARERYERVMAGGTDPLFTTRFRRKSGAEVFIEVNPRRFDRADGTRTVELVTRDVTERVRAERRQHKLEVQLGDARRMEHIGRLAGGVAHDFNNVLTVFLGNSDLGMNSTDVMEMRRLFAELNEAATHASRLTRQLLTFARRQPIEPRGLDVAQVVRDLQPFLRRLLPEKIDIDVQIEDVELSVRGDPGQIQQVVVNLVANARDAMPEGGQLTLGVRTEEVDSASDRPPLRYGHYVVLSVNDTGAGMDAETIARAFDPFFTTKPEGQGTGLGLATVRGIVEESGGHVFVASRPTVGSRFEVYLPAAEPVDAVGAAWGPEVSRMGAGTILVVDDQAAVRGVVTRALTSYGYRVAEAGSAADALKLLERIQTPSLLVTDVVMPGESGPRLAKRLRERNPDLPVLFMSGYADGANEADAASVGGAGFIAKPFSPDDLVSRVRELLDRGGVATAITH